MKVLRSIGLAFSLFSRLPAPHLDWQEDNMAYALAALPLVGLVIGLLLLAWQALAGAWGFGPLLRAAGLTLLPLAVSGGLHLDGFADTVDALSSHGDQEQKRRIMKDPHCGAFAVMGIAGYLLLYAALAAELPSGICWLLLPLPVLSRALGALASLTFAPAAGPGPGLLSTCRQAAAKGAKSAAGAGIILAGLGLLLLDWRAGGLMLALAGLFWFYTRRLAQRQFAGFSGDLAGFLIQLSELLMLAGAAALAGKFS